MGTKDHTHSYFYKVADKLSEEGISLSTFNKRLSYFFNKATQSEFQDGLNISLSILHQKAASENTPADSQTQALLSMIKLSEKLNVETPTDKTFKENTTAALEELCTDLRNGNNPHAASAARAYLQKPKTP